MNHKLDCDKLVSGLCSLILLVEEQLSSIVPWIKTMRLFLIFGRQEDILGSSSLQSFTNFKHRVQMVFIDSFDFTFL